MASRWRTRPSAISAPTGRLRPGAFPESITALNDSTPELAVARPYAVDLTGWFEGFSHPGTQDANGGTSRVAPVVGVGSVESGALNLCSGLVLQLIPNCSSIQNLLSDPTDRLPFTKSLLTTGQGDRCPGSMERGALLLSRERVPVQPESEVPTGQ